MSLDQHQHGHAPDHGTPERARPRLELPRFEFAPRTPLAQPAAAMPAPAPTPTHVAPTFSASRFLPAHGAAAPTAPHREPAYQQPQQPPAPTMPTPTYAPAPRTYAPRVHAPVQQQYVPAVHTPAAPAYAPVAAPASTIAATPTRPATSISWDRLEPEVEQRTFLQRVTPRHMGVLLVVVVGVMIMTSGPAAMKTPTGLPTVAEGGGGMMPVQPRAGSAAVGAAAAASTPAPVAAKAKVKAPAKARVVTKAGGLAPGTIDVVGVALSANVQHGGMPSGAAVDRITAVDGGGTGPAAVDDGVTLPTSGERDAHGAERRIDGGGAIDDIPVTPVMTPGSAAKVAEEIVAAPAGSTPAPNTISAF